MSDEVTLSQAPAGDDDERRCGSSISRWVGTGSCFQWVARQRGRRPSAVAVSKTSELCEETQGRQKTGGKNRGRIKGRESANRARGRKDSATAAVTHRRAPGAQPFPGPERSERRSETAGGARRVSPLRGTATGRARRSSTLASRLRGSNRPYHRGLIDGELRGRADLKVLQPAPAVRHAVPRSVRGKPGMQAAARGNAVASSASTGSGWPAVSYRRVRCTARQRAVDAPLMMQRPWRRGKAAGRRIFGFDEGRPAPGVSVNDRPVVDRSQEGK